MNWFVEISEAGALRVLLELAAGKSGFDMQDEYDVALLVTLVRWVTSEDSGIDEDRDQLHTASGDS
jgi:hypothetical protein